MLLPNTSSYLPKNRVSLGRVVVLRPTATPPNRFEETVPPPGPEEMGAHWQQTLQRVLAEEIRELYHSEIQLATAWPRMAIALSDRVIQAAFEILIRQNEPHIQRLNLAARALGLSPDGVPGLTMEGLLIGVHEIIQENHHGRARDLALLDAVLKIHLYLITTYCCARDFAQLQNLAAVAEVLQASVEDKTTMELRLANLTEFMHQPA